MKEEIDSVIFDEIEKKVLDVMKTTNFYEPTEEERNILKVKYFWIGYEGVFFGKAPAGHLTATGTCQADWRTGKQCEEWPASGLMTAHYGCNVVPCCHACWSNID